MPPVSASSTYVVAAHGRRRHDRRRGHRLHAGDARSIAAADSGSTASSPRNDWPGATRSRFVPSRSSCASRSALRGLRDAEHGDHRRDADRDPERRQRRPQRAACAARARRCAGRRRAGGSVRSARVGRVADHAPSRISTRRGKAAAISRSCVITTIVEPAAVQLAAAAPGCPRRSGCRGCRSARRRTRSPAARRAPARSRRAGARRPTASTAGASSRCAEPDALERLARPPRAARAAPRPRRAAQSRRCRARSSRRAGRTAGRRSRSRARAAPPARARRAPPRPARRPRRAPRVGRSSVPMTCSSVDLPEPDGPTTATSSPAVDAQRRRRAAPRRRPGRSCAPSRELAARRSFGDHHLLALAQAGAGRPRPVVGVQPGLDRTSRRRRPTQLDARSRRPGARAAP